MTGRLTLCVLSWSLIAGCTTPVLYDYGHYSREQFRMRQDQGTAAATYMEELVRIIERSDTAGNSPPPGIHAEYGYFLAKQGDRTKAKEHFEREVELYPEAHVYVGFLARELESLDPVGEGHDDE